MFVMTRMGIAALALTCCALLGCKTGKDQATRLNDDELAALSLTTHSLARADQAAAMAQPDALEFVARGAVPLLRWVFPSSHSLQSIVQSPSGNQQLGEMVRFLRTCSFDVRLPVSNGPIPEEGYYYFIADGNDCPVQMKHTIGYSLSGSDYVTGYMDVRRTYAVTDDSFSDLNDTQAYGIEGRIHVEGDRLRQSIQMAGELNGYLDSIQNGRVTVSQIISVNIDPQGTTAQLILTYIFKDFTAIGKADISQSSNGFPKLSFSINDVSVSQREFEMAFSGNFDQDLPQN